jgi:hypothetical protein
VTLHVVTIVRLLQTVDDEWAAERSQGHNRGEAITMLNAAHVLHCSITVINLILKHLQVLIPSLHEVTNCVMAEIRQARPVVNLHFYFLITVELVTSQVLFRWPTEVLVLQHDSAT